MAKSESRSSESASERVVTRRGVLKVGLALGGLSATSAFLVACGNGGATAAPSTGAPSTAAPSVPELPSGTTSLGSNRADEKPKAALAAVVAEFTRETGIEIAVNTVDTTKFSDTLSSYLQGTPDDIFTWFAGFRARYFAGLGLSTPIDDVWATMGSNFSEGFKSASTGNDGQLYFLPTSNYPWAVFYRKSLFAEKGYEIPTSWAGFKALGDRMLADGIHPMGFGDADGWPAMGYFDILNLRLNGYQFHVDLMAGTEKWDDPRITKVFETWAELVPYYQPGFMGRKFQETGQTLAQKTAGMCYFGMFISQQIAAEDQDDLDFFQFPYLGNEFDAEQAIEAPIDGFMLSKAPQNLDAAKAFLEFMGTGPAQALLVKEDPSAIAAANDADTSGYTALQVKGQQLINSAGRISQFLDRDTRPDFAGPNGMQGFLQSFLTDPKQDLRALQSKIQSFYDSLGPIA